MKLKKISIIHTAYLLVILGCAYIIIWWGVFIKSFRKSPENDFSLHEIITNFGYLPYEYKMVIIKPIIIEMIFPLIFISIGIFILAKEKWKWSYKNFKRKVVNIPEKLFASKSYICTNCNNKVKIEDKICPHCGEDISEIIKE